MTHTIEIGSLVEISGCGVEYDGLRLWVVDHAKDCDGTALYTLSHDLTAQNEYNQTVKEMESSTDPVAKRLCQFAKFQINGALVRGFSEESLTVIMR